MPESEPEADPRVVFVAESTTIADAVISLLNASGIIAEAHVPPPPETSSEPLTGASELVWKRNDFQIRVQDESKAAAARELIAAAVTDGAVKAVRERRANRTGTVSATCEDCGKASEWPAQALGTTEVCPHCGNYMDIPDPDEDWSDVDFGESEGETEEEEG